LFSGIGFSQADDAAATRFPVAARGPDGYDHASVEAADGDETWLAIVSAIVRDGQRRSCENLASARHIESAIVDDRLAFGGVEFDLQVITVATKYKAGQRAGGGAFGTPPPAKADKRAPR
jgi:hypothetical protein